MYNRYLQYHPPPECLPPQPQPPPGLLNLRLPGKLETGDLLVLAILMLLYLEKKDEELLVMLAAYAVLSL